VKFLIVGCGSIGQRHAKNLKMIYPDLELSAFRTTKTKIGFIDELGIKEYFDLTEALDHNPDAVLITNPTSFHIPVAITVAKRCCHLFIEKPLSNSMQNVDEFIDVVRKNHIKVLIGCNLRFYPSLNLIKDLLKEKRIGRVVSVRAEAGQYLPDWRPNKDYRKIYSSRKSLGGGVILDLIHELDYLYWFFGDVEKVFSLSGKLSNLDIETEDFAEILMQFRNGIIAEIHLDYIQRKATRTCQIIGEEGTIAWDYHKNEVKVFSVDKGDWEILCCSQNYEINSMYIEEMRHFVNCIRNQEDPLIDIVDGKKVLEIALAAKESAKTEKLISLDFNA